MKKKKINLPYPPLKKGGNEILSKIKSGEIKMKPKWEFAVKAMGIRGMWALLLSGVAWSVLGIVYFVNLYNPIELAQFGDVGRQVFLEDFPYYWLLGTGLFLFLATRLLSKLGENYRKTTKWMVLITGIGALLITAMMFLVRKLFLQGFF